MNTIAYITDSADISLNDSHSNGGTTGIYLNDAYIKITSVELLNYSIGIDIGETGTAYLLMDSVYIDKSSTWDLRVQNSNSVVRGLNNFLHDSLISFTNGTPAIEYALSHFSNDLGSETSITKSAFAVGAPDRPSIAGLGEGHAYTRGMLVYQYDSVNGYTNVTAKAQSYTNSTFGFSSVAVNSAIYVSSTLKIDDTYSKFFGVEVKINTGGVAGTGVCTAEYWNGTTWVALYVMRTHGTAPYYPTTISLAGLPAGIYQCRFNARINDTWIANDPVGLGINTYWIRLRITSEITSSPLIEQILLHSNQTKINTDGWIEFYGKARPVGRMPWNYGMIQAASSSPGNQDQYLSDTLDVGKIENLFVNNATDRIGFLAPVPFELDTSTPIRLRWAARYSEATGNITWNVRWGYSTSTDIIYTSQAEAPTTHATQQLLTVTEAVPSTIGQIKWHTVDISVANMNPRNSDGVSDILWLTIERDGITDTFAGTAGFVAIAGDYLQWTVGGHITYAV